MPSERITLKTKTRYLAWLESQEEDTEDDVEGGLLGGDEAAEDVEGTEDDTEGGLLGGDEDDDDIADMFAADEDETEQALTEADVRAAAEALLKRRGGATLRRLLSSIFDARRISEVPEARWAEFVKAANAE